MRNKPDPDAFETFYKDVRGRLLLQTWALTGDLTAAQKAVRDALVIGWHHWRKVNRLEDPESFVRPQAWSHALRRHTARPFHRERRFDEGIRATLTALGKLPLLQRKVLLLAHLTTLPLDQLAREAGLTQARAERELQTATATFALARNVPTTSILGLFEPMAAELRDLRWPRATIITRAGTARRRTHTAVGAAIALVAFAGSGVLVTDANGVRPTLDTLSLHTPEPDRPAPAYPLTTDELVSARQVQASLGGAWTTELTSDNTDGDGLVLPCQQQRFADRSARAALMRTLVSGDMQSHGSSVGQSTEVSTTAAAAHATYASSITWYAGCREPRLQLISTRQVSGIGDEATLLELRDWNDPARSIVASVARTGVLTTTLVSAQPVPGKQPVRANTGLLAQAVGQLCELPDGGSCVSRPTTRQITPIPVGEHTAMLDEVDLPPVQGVRQPWLATAPKAAINNLAATRCDQSVFHRKGVTGDLTRSYVVPAAKLPPQFGLTETIGSFGTAKAAARFVADTRAALATCPKKDLGTKAALVESTATPARELAIWRLNVEISDKSSVVFLMAIVREGDNVAQLCFVPSGPATISDDAFAALAHRAAERLHQLG
jgi:DNA-directed RNA polymerase specialized sigma24 family protein